MANFVFFYRYMEKNVRCHEKFRTYIRELPEFLVNRPRYFVEHCQEKITLATDIGRSSIKPSDTGGVFEVKSDSLNKQWYRVQFGDNLTKVHHPHANVRHGSEGAYFASTSLQSLSTSQSGTGGNCRKTIGTRPI